MYPIGKDSFCRGLSVCLRGRHASEAIDTNRGGDAGHCGGADAWRSTATCIVTGRQTEIERNSKHFAVSFPQEIMEMFYFDWPPSNSWKCQRGRSSGLVKTLNVRADFLSQYGLYCDTVALRWESKMYRSTEAAPILVIASNGCQLCLCFRNISNAPICSCTFNHPLHSVLFYCNATARP